MQTPTFRSAGALLSSRGANDWSQLVTLALGGVIFCAVFYARYLQIPTDMYALRDDGLITLSHARNLVDFGFVGVSPSGGRVEGFSAPLQFLIYAVLYGVGNYGYQEYATLQTFVCTFALGALFVSFFPNRVVAGLILTTTAALGLSYSTSFLEWHGSGMENALTHVFYLATVLILVRFAVQRAIRGPLSLIVLMASISRIESIYHIGPLLVIFTFYWRASEGSWEGLRFSLIVLMGWLIINLGRYLYFGELVPNTAYAQSISLKNRLLDLLALDFSVWKRSGILAGTIFVSHGGYVVLAAGPLLLFVKRDRVVLLTFILLGSLLVTSFFNPFLFGQTRLDPTRSTSFVAVVVMLWMALLIFHINWKGRSVWILTIPAAIATMTFAVNVTPPHELCCRISDFKSFGAAFASLAERERLPRPTVANSDLGAMSWHKQFNIIDLGRLGSPIMAKVASDAALADYFLDVASPDFIELHVSYFSCHDREVLFSDPRFAAQYEPLIQKRENWPPCGPEPMPNGIWVRRDVLADASSRERALIDRLQISLQAPIPAVHEWQETGREVTNALKPTAGTRNVMDAIAALAQEIEACQQQIRACMYIARTAHRFLPEFRAAGAMEELLAVFVQSPTKEYDVAWLNAYRDSGAEDRMIYLLQTGKVH